MARKRKHKRRYRRVGAMGFGGKKDTGMKLLAVAGGFLLGDTINTQLNKVLPKTKNPTTNVDEPNETIGIAAEVGLGGLLLMRKKSSMPVTLAGGVLAGAGLKRLAKKMGFMSGYQSVPVIGKHKMAGYQSVPVIGAMPPQLSGRMPSQLQGFRVNGYVPVGSAGVMNGFDGGSGVGGGYMQ